MHDATSALLASQYYLEILTVKKKKKKTMVDCYSSCSCQALNVSIQIKSTIQFCLYISSKDDYQVK